ncbi:MAG: menaquinone-dependent protoporphyrinogen IX dehydrogenase [Gammaproteobacteria bacterium]|uniref:Protoporphyrinogen IX dehydrogenase [quinone] n=1 Tax=SAR86 cluster bacterium TaxID=2030880 RepID=A0A520MXY7_9GAMM|nr:menaquinone-dependent protoporphyrinogen IX dehydrogenase [Gammaproteobacteria bacterium]MBA4729924.1 menaquinone-dependent protoporphyrinogen IX dehydrogenase [SAR86 cluster bacterium]RZO26036.1 MAG: menaquinone-dependent protoporphyrinogen IX dehydrogenase [SAR86 cluster bacterium]|tara:strand:+ start:15563 stop:16096 length:534 start_codon:yes stop_codon:yes gene_type:complete
MSRKVLFIHSSVDGHTAKICDHMSKKFDQKFNTETIPLEKAQFKDLESNEVIIIGASIRYGNHRPLLYKFINQNEKILNQRSAYFFTVNAVARRAEKRTIKNNPYVKKFLKKVNWSPKKIGIFPGKIDYPKYKFFDKHMIRLIMYFSGGPTDLNNSYEFTDWQEIDAFAEEIKKNNG